MAKKLIVQRNLRRTKGGGAPYLKYLVFSAIGLIFLVVITPYLLRDKSHEMTKKRPVPESGVVTKELPTEVRTRPAPEKPTDLAGAAGNPESAGPAGGGAYAGPESVNPKQPQSAPEPAPKAVTASQEPSAPQQAPPAAAPGPGEKGMAASQTENVPPAAAPQNVISTQPGQTSQQVLFPKSENPSEAPPAEARNPRPKAVKETGGTVRRKKTVISAKKAPKPKTLRCAKPAAKPAACEKPSGSYAVQVGSVFKNISRAESIRKHLAARGYKASIRHVGASGYLVVTSSSSRSSAYTLMAQMNAGGLKNTKIVGASAQPAQAAKR
ncbi:MAG: SPOR domain-containing protein [Syntrophobacteraceae bacterium]|nr:SPOR domain-containing protein [Syntrophobacteraceae bacterium]